MSLYPNVGRMAGAAPRGAKALTATPAAVIARAAQRAAEPKHSATDVVSHTVDGYREQRERLGLGSPLIPPDLAETARVLVNSAEASQALARDVTHHWHSSNVGTTGRQIIGQIGKELDNLGKADGALQHVGATFALLTSLEQLVSAPLAKIPFPALPALRVGDYDVGLPHGHMHPPNLIPPEPMIPLPSTGPVIPIPYVSGASKTLINNMPAARCGDLGLGVWCGGYVPLYEVFLGSASVWIEGCRAARMGVDVTNHCIFSARKGPDDKPIGAFVGFTINGSPNVAVGGVPMPSLTNMVIGAGMKQLFKGAGRVLKALRKAKPERALSKKLAELAEKAHPPAPHSPKPRRTIPGFDAPKPALNPGHAQVMDHLDIMLNEFSDQVRHVVRMSPTLSEQLRQLFRDGWSVVRREGGGHIDRDLKEIVIPPGRFDEEIGNTAHEAGHAMRPAPLEPPRKGLTEAEYVERSVQDDMLEEGHAQYNAAKVRDEIINNRGPDVGIPGEQAKDFKDVYNAHKNGMLDKDQAVEDMADLMRNETTGNTKEPYPDYYGNGARDQYWNP
jgi:uncharacterized Zn-binding protein involved in type VI secretion